MKFSREAMVQKPKMTRIFLNICKNKGDKYVEISQEPTERFKRWCKERGIKWTKEKKKH